MENNPKVFLDSLSGLESFFKWYHLRDGRFFFLFVELKGTTNVWWEIFQHFFLLNKVRTSTGMKMS